MSRNVVSFPQYYAASASSSLRTGPKDIPKRSIVPKILRRFCFIKPEDGTERYPETSYLSHNIRPRPNPKCYNNSLFSAWVDSDFNQTTQTLLAIVMSTVCTLMSGIRPLRVVLCHNTYLLTYLLHGAESFLRS